MEEIEVLVDPSWPHLQPVYEFFLQLIVNDAADVKTLKVFITLSFVQEVYFKVKVVFGNY
jgi:serine/threonine-protein phosphatase 2A regulatory subunit B'